METINIEESRYNEYLHQRALIEHIKNIADILADDNNMVQISSFVLKVRIYLDNELKENKLTFKEFIFMEKEKLTNNTKTISFKEYERCIITNHTIKLINNIHKRKTINDSNYTFSMLRLVNCFFVE